MSENNPNRLPITKPPPPPEKENVLTSAENANAQQQQPETLTFRGRRKMDALERQRLAEIEQKERKGKAMKALKYLLKFSQKLSDTYKENTEIGDEKNEAFSKDMNQVVSSLKYFKGGKLYDYQKEGVIWLISLYMNAVNGILADEMGLGKTIQIIALICYLFEKNVLGPYLIICPLSTLTNWEAEFRRFAPRVPVVRFYGDKDERKKCIRDASKKYQIGQNLTLPVILTTYESIKQEPLFFRTMSHRYVIVDEGHKLKNYASQISQLLRKVPSKNRLILTGTPLQNNIYELWSLLSYLMPDLFNNITNFSEVIILQDFQSEEVLSDLGKSDVINSLHNVIAPFILRRLKKDVLPNIPHKREFIVYCPLTPLQEKLYKYALDRQLALLMKTTNGEVEDMVQPKKKRRITPNFPHSPDSSSSFSSSNKENNLYIANLLEFEDQQNGDRRRYLYNTACFNSAMGFKHIANHPYIVRNPLDPNSKEKKILVDENLVKDSGKLSVLNVMLPELQRRGHKVLLFTTSVLALDYIEDFIEMRGFKYSRLDGNVKLEERDAAIDQFKTDDDTFIFLISTRAGGLGLNLMVADTVIFYDRDWNPQADIQAQDRCYRIGQEKNVIIYTLVSRGTIDEKIIERGKDKLLLEQVIIEEGNFQKQSERDEFKKNLLDLKKIFDDMQKETFSASDIHKILDRSKFVYE